MIPEYRADRARQRGERATNPDFERMLRGTVHDPTTRRMGGVAGHAGVFSTAGDVALFAQALLDRLAGRPSDFPLGAGDAEADDAAGATGYRGFGRDDLYCGWQDDDGSGGTGIRVGHQSAFSRPRGEVFPIGSFGHTGFTGTSPLDGSRRATLRRSLANAVHPRGAAADLRASRDKVGDGCVLQGSTVFIRKRPSLVTLTGIDVLEATHFAVLARGRETSRRPSAARPGDEPDRASIARAAGRSISCSIVFRRLS